MPRKAVPEFELTDLSTHDSDRLLENQSAGKTAGPLSDSNSRFRDFLRHARLMLPGTLIGLTLPWISPVEQRKVAAYQSRRMAILNSLLHLIPLGGATALLVLFWTKYWTGKKNDNATTLQFVAKFHELLMQSSLVDVLLYVIRAQALEGYVPLGAISGMAQAPQISYLWSLDFLSALRSQHFGWWRKIVFAMSVTILLFMASVVGPSSAVLMIPRPDMTEVQFIRERHQSVPEDLLFPTVIDSTHGLNFSKNQLYNDLNLLVARYPRDPEDGDTNIWPTDRNGSPLYGEDPGYKIDEVIMWSSTNYLPEDAPYFMDGLIVATLPTNLAAQQLMKDCVICAHMVVDPEAKGAMTIRTVQPLVSNTCASVLAGSVEDLGEWVSFKTPDGSMHDLITFSELTDTHWSDLDMSSFDYAPPVWKTDPDNSGSLVGIFLTDRGESREDLRYVVTSCFISSYWWLTDTTVDFLQDPSRRRMRVKRPKLSNTGLITDTKNVRPITVNTTDMEFLNSERLTWTVTHQEVSALAMIWAATLATLPAAQFDLHQNQSESDELDKRSESRWSYYALEAMEYGLGYGARDTASKLAAAVLTTYWFISFFFVVYIITTGHTSIAWDSAMELIILALPSKEPDGLGHVSVGLDSMDTFGKSVGIRVSTVPIEDTGEKWERLELVFEHDQDLKQRNLTKVVRNRAY